MTKKSFRFLTQYRNRKEIENEEEEFSILTIQPLYLTLN